MEASIYMYKAIERKQNNLKAAVCVDSKNVAEQFDKAKVEIRESRFEDYIIKILVQDYTLISTFYINRIWNHEADSMAKQGRERSYFIEKWF